MPELRATILLELDGEPLADMPIVRRYIVNEQSGLGTIQLAPDNNSSTFHPIAALTMSNLGIFFLATDSALNLDINQLTALPLNANGLILILGAALAQGTPTENITLNNPATTGSASANVNILGGGT